MQWNEYPKTKPIADVVAYATNIRANGSCYLTNYSMDKDVFFLTPYNTMPIDVTHYVEMPPAPNAIEPPSE